MAITRETVGPVHPSGIGRDHGPTQPEVSSSGF
jgi:hypothetical protein